MVIAGIVVSERAENNPKWEMKSGKQHDQKIGRQENKRTGDDYDSLIVPSMRLFRPPGHESCEDDCKLLGARVDDWMD